MNLFKTKRTARNNFSNSELIQLERIDETIYSHLQQLQKIIGPGKKAPHDAAASPRLRNLLVTIRSELNGLIENAEYAITISKSDM